MGTHTVIEQRWRWRLHYPDREPVEEASGGTSIKLAPRGAIKLEAVGKAVDIPPGMRPIWYRHRGITLDGSGAMTLATIAGYGHVLGSGQCEAVLFLLTARDWVDCPLHLIDTGALENCLEG